MDAICNHITTAMRQRTSMQGRATPMEPGTLVAGTARVVPMPTVAVIRTIRAAEAVNLNEAPLGGFY
jgi:hypothetical protein